MLYLYGMKLGFKALLHGKLKSALPYLVVPVNYWRSLEYRLTYDEGKFQSSDRILDIGSPKVLSLYLAKKLGAEVYSTDIEDYFIKEYEFFRQVEQVSAGKLHNEVQDGRKLTYPDNYFTKVFSISVIEHIPDSGDSACVQEINRVLAPGGRCVITVPFAIQSQNDYKADNFYWAKSSVAAGDGKVFFQRRYSEADLYARLIKPSGLKLKKLQYIGEKVMVHAKKELCEVLPRVTGPVQPLLSTLCLSEPVDDWKTLQKPLAALIVLEK